MKISTPRAPRQLELFARPIKTMAVTRNLCGEFVEELTASIGDAIRLRTDGTADYCPDLQRRGSSNVYYETKSIGHNGAAIIYESRLLKDRNFNQPERTLMYWFWRHEVKIKGLESDRILWSRLAENLRYAILLPFWEVFNVAQQFPIRMLNKKYSGGGVELGYGNRSKGYGDGRSIRLKALRGVCDCVVYCSSAEVLGVTVPPVAVFTMERYAYLVNHA